MRDLGDKPYIIVNYGVIMILEIIDEAPTTATPTTIS